MLGRNITFTLLTIFILGINLGWSQSPEIDWDKTLGGSGWEELHSMTPTSDGGILIAAITQSPNDGDVQDEKIGDWDYWLVKLNDQGDIEWQRRYGGDKADRIWVSRETRDGGFIIGGESLSDISGDKTEPSRGDWDFWMIKVDRNGLLEWDKTIGGDGHDAIRGDIIELNDGGFLVAGVSDSNVGADKTEPSRGDWDYWVVRTDRRGQVIWDKTFGGDQKELMQAAIALPDGSFLLGGESRSGVSGDKDDFLRGLNDYWALRIDTNGNLLWQKTIGGNWDEAIFDIARGEDGTIYLAGFSGSDATFEKSNPSYGSIDYWIVAIDENGNILWDKNYGGRKPDTAYDIRINELGNLVVGGIANSEVSGVKTASSEGSIDYWVIYLTPDGEMIWDETYGSTLRDALTEIEIGLDGSIYMAGHSESNVGGDKTETSRGVNDIWVVKTTCDLAPQMQDSIPIGCQDNQLILAADFAKCRSCIYEWQDAETDSLNLVQLPIPDRDYSVRALDVNGCIAYDTTHLYNSPIDSVDYEIYTEDCLVEVRINQVYGGTAPYEFDFYELGQPLDAQRPLGMDKDYALEMRDSVDCRFDTLDVFGTDEELLVTLGEDILVELGDSLIVEVFSNRAIQSVQWTNIDANDCYDCSTIRTIAIDPATVFATVKDEFGCVAEDHIDIRLIKDYETYIPNIFSPDGDGQNDFFTVYGGKDVKQVHSFQVFDRWGQPVFKRNDIELNNPNEGWAGTKRNIEAPPGVYIYYAEVEFIDGHHEIFKGDVLLSR